MATSKLTPFDGQLDSEPTGSALKPFDGTLDGEKPRTRGLIEALNDNVIEFANAAAGGVSSAANFLSPGNKLSSFIDENIIKSGEQKQSDVVRAEKQRLSEGLQNAGGVADELGAVGSYVVSNPLLAASQAAGSFALPGGVVKGVGGAAKTLGAGVKGIEAAGRAGGIAAGAAMAGGDAAGTAYDLSKNAGATEEQAVAAGRQASLIPAAVGGLTGAFGAERLLAGGQGFAGNALSRGLKSGLSEAAQEGLEEGVTQYEGQRAAMPYDATIDPSKGVAGAAGMGAIMGFGPGAVLGAMQGQPLAAAAGGPNLNDQQGVDDAIQPVDQPGAAPIVVPTTQKPSEAMGINPAAGPLSRAAASSVDSAPQVAAPVLPVAKQAPAASGQVRSTYAEASKDWVAAGKQGDVIREGGGFRFVANGTPELDAWKSRFNKGQTNAAQELSETPVAQAPVRDQGGVEQGVFGGLDDRPSSVLGTGSGAFNRPEGSASVEQPRQDQQPVERPASSDVKPAAVLRDMAEQFRQRFKTTEKDTDRTFAAVLDEFASDIEQGKRDPASVADAMRRYGETLATPAVKKGTTNAEKAQVDPAVAQTPEGEKNPASVSGGEPVTQSEQAGGGGVNVQSAGGSGQATVAKPNKLKEARNARRTADELRGTTGASTGAGTNIASPSMESAVADVRSAGRVDDAGTAQPDAGGDVGRAVGSAAQVPAELTDQKKKDRRYIVVAINEKTGKRTVVSPEPMTHAEAVNNKGRFNARPEVRIQLEEVSQQPTDRPNGWRSNAIKAGKVAKQLGLDPKGKRLAQIVAEIDAKDGNVQDTPQGTAGEATKAAPVEAREAEGGNDAGSAGVPAAPGASDEQADGVSAQPQAAEKPEVSDTSDPVDSIQVREGKGALGRGTYLAFVDGESAPGGPFGTPEQAYAAGVEWKQKTIQNAKNSAAEKARWADIADKFRTGSDVTTAEIESLGLKAGTSDVRWFFPIAARLFDITSRDIRPLVRDLIRSSLTDMGAKREFVPTRKALEAIASELQKEVNAAPEGRSYLVVPFEYKAFAKNAGAKWDADKKLWFTDPITGGSAKGDLNVNLRQFIPADYTEDDKYNYYSTKEAASAVAATAEIRDGKPYRAVKRKHKDGAMLWSALPAGPAQAETTKPQAAAPKEDAAKDAGDDAFMGVEQTETEAFKRWFGDSKVVDAKGKPLVVYHGAPDLRFLKEDGTFKSQKEKLGFGRSEAAHWFTPSLATARSYADPRRAFDYQNAEEGTVATYLRMENPLIVDGGGQNWRDAQKRGKTSDVIEEARKGGHDGVIIRNVKDDYNNTKSTRATDTYVVFDSKQIKSATNNKGTFDPTDPDITNYGSKKARAAATPVDRAVMDMAGEGREANDILRFIAGASKSPFRKQLADLLVKTGANPSVSLGGDMGGGQGFKFLAKYSRKNHEVTLSEAASDRAEQIFLHETVHSATLMALDRGGQYADQMKRLAAQVYKVASPEMRKQYGLTLKKGTNEVNVGEFVAEAFTNPEFQKQLKGIPVLGRSAWQRFVAMVRRIIGMDVEAQNALEQALELGAQVMRENVALRKAQSFRAEDGPAFAGVDQTETEAFKKWFGDSKVVDANGRPLVVYHGTGGDITSFDPDAGTGGNRGLFFASNPDLAAVYAKDSGAVYPVYVALKNPLVIDGTRFSPSGLKGRIARLIAPKAYQEGQKEQALKDLLTDGDAGRVFTKRDVEAIQAAGYDGVITTQAFPGYAEVIVAFRPEQIKSATGNRGTFDPDDADISHFGIADAAEQIKAFDVKTAPKNTWAHYRGMALQALGRRQITELYAEELPQLETYNDLVQKMDAEKNDSGAEADRVAQDWGSLKEGMDRKLAELMHDATLAKMDPDKSMPAGYSKKEYDALKARFDALSPEAKAVYRKARDMYVDHYKAVQQAIKDRIERSDMSEGQKRKLMADLDSRLFKELQGVYFPLARFGQYVIVVKNANGEVVNVTRAETVKEAETVRKELQKAFPAHMGNTVGKVLKQAEFNAGRDAVGKGFMADLMGALDEKGVDDELRDTVAQLYLSSLPDLSWAKHGIHRKGTPGFSQDARRAFAQNMFHGARYLAKLRHADQLQDLLIEMQDHVKAYEGVEEYDSIQAQQVVDEMVKRHEWLMNPKSSPVSTALTSFGFLFHMGLSPASAMVNLTQTALVAYPQMGAKWGFAKAGAALTKASQEVVKAKNDLSTVLKGDELDAFNQAVKDGTIDVTMAHDLAGIAQGEDQGVMWKVRPVMRWASFMFHHAEKFNRQATFLAAYRLAKEQNPNDTQRQLYEQAKQATYDGHFDYSSANRPRLMQGNWQRVIFLFKNYSQHMVYGLARNAYQSIKALDPKERTQARKTLAGILAAHAAAAGVLGLPLVGPLLTVASWIGGDDDEPWDAEVAMQNAMAEMLGPKASEVIARGFSRLTPFDLSGRVALNKLILPDVQEGLEGKEWAESAMAAALGPVAGIGVNVARGAQKITEGDYLRGLEDMMPTVLRGPIKSYRYFTEGAQDKTGVTITDDVSAAGEVGQFLGLSPSQVRRDTERRGAIYAYDRALLERRSVLMRMFAEARMNGDEETAQEVQKDIQRFNEKNPTRRITPMNIAQSIRNRRKRVQEAEQGVYLPSKRRDALDAVTF